MKATVRQEHLAAAVAQVAPHYATRPTHAIYGSVRLAVRDGVLHLAAFDGDTGSRSRLDCTSHEEGAIAVSGALLVKWVKALPEEDVLLDSSSGLLLEITAGSTSLGMPLLREEEFPALPPLPPAVAKVDAAALASAVKSVSVAADRDASSGVPALYAVRVEVTPETLRLVATDRTRIHLQEIDAEGLVESATLYPFAGASLSWLSTLTGEVTLYAGDNAVWGASDDVALVTAPQVALESWTAYESLIYAEKPSALVFETSAIKASLTRALLAFAASERPVIGLLPGEESVTIQIRHEAHTFTAEVPCAIEGDPVEDVIGINARLLLDAINHVGSDTVRLHVDKRAMNVTGASDDRRATVALVKWRIK